MAAKELGAARGLCAAGALPPPLHSAWGWRAALSQDSFATLAALVALAAFLAALERPTRGRFARLALAFGFRDPHQGKPRAPRAADGGLDRDRAAGQRLARRGAAHADFALAAAGVLALVVWVVAAGSFASVRRLVEIVLASPATNAYALRFGGGPWWRYLVDFLALSPVPTLLGLAGIALTSSARGASAPTNGPRGSSSSWLSSPR